MPQLLKSERPGACALQQEKPPQAAARTPQLAQPLLTTTKASPHARLKIKKSIKKIFFKE